MSLFNHVCFSAFQDFVYLHQIFQDMNAILDMFSVMTGVQVIFKLGVASLMPAIASSGTKYSKDFNLSSNEK